MPRPKKCRRVEFIPDTTYFKPAGIPPRVLKEVVVSFEEAEAVRLKDLEGLEQGEAARRMGISRATFQRVLASSRQKTTTALLHGQAIKIEGGDFDMARRRFRCGNDGTEWDVMFEKMVSGDPQSCPQCHSSNVHPVPPRGFGGRGRGPRGGRGRAQGRRW